MPTYDYRCDACGHEFELFQSMKDNPKRKCPECGNRSLIRKDGCEFCTSCGHVGACG